MRWTDRAKARTVHFIAKIQRRQVNTTSRSPLKIWTTETNFITTVEEALDIIVDHKNLRLCVDIYHMRKEGESPSSIVKAKNYIIYCEVAEKEGRTPPGVQGDDFRPYFTALKQVGYHDKISIECRWEDVAAQGQMAFQKLQTQIQDVYGGK